MSAHRSCLNFQTIYLVTVIKGKRLAERKAGEDSIKFTAREKLSRAPRRHSSVFVGHVTLRSLETHLDFWKHICNIQDIGWTHYFWKAFLKLKFSTGCKSTGWWLRNHQRCCINTPSGVRRKRPLWVALCLQNFTRRSGIFWLRGDPVCSSSATIYHILFKGDTRDVLRF